MSALYTVRMFRQKLVYSYDPATGRRVNEREERLEVVITDLPHVTAIGYKFRFPTNEVTIARQEYSADTPVRRNARRDYYERDDSPAPVMSEDVETRVEDDAVAAAIAGDLSAGLTTEAA